MNDLISKVSDLLKSDDSGHNMDHVMRVLRLATDFAKKEHADIEIVSYIALLHDVDDYKLFGIEDAKKLPHARKILEECKVPQEKQKLICSELTKIGYSTRLKGFAPETLEGKVVSDADMCDALGVTGVIRTYQYSLKHGNSFFDKTIFPRENLEVNNYMKTTSSTSVCHIFEKILKLKGLILTKAGKQEAQNRHQIVVEMLHHLFEEENVPEWEEYYNQYLSSIES